MIVYVYFIVPLYIYFIIFVFIYISIQMDGIVTYTDALFWLLEIFRGFLHYTSYIVNMLAC